MSRKPDRATAPVRGTGTEAAAFATAIDRARAVAQGEESAD